MRKLVAVAVVGLALGVIMFGTSGEDDQTQTNIQYRDSLKSGTPSTTDQPTQQTSPPATSVVPTQPGVHQEEDVQPESSELYLISSNVDDSEFPLRKLTDLAVQVLQAELTGLDAQSYPHLAGETQPCCENLQINSAVVIFAAQGEPIKISIEWTATLLGSGEQRTETTPSLWWRQPDGTMKGDFEQ